MRRYSAKRRSRTRRGGLKSRYVKYTFTRMTDFQYINVDPLGSSPEVAAQSTTGILPVGNMVTPLTIDSTGPSALGTTNWSAAFIFKLSNLPNINEFINTTSPAAGLFEQYKLKGIQIEIDPIYRNKELLRTTQALPDLGTGLNTTYTPNYAFPTPTMWYKQDNDQASVINWPSIQQDSGIKKLSLNRVHRLWVKPNVVVPIALDTDGPSQFTTTRKAPWIVGTNPNVEHYGLRFYMQDWPGPNDLQVGPDGDQVGYCLRIRMRYYFQFRGVI